MPIYRNQETGHEVEVMAGTILPKVYRKVEKVKAPKSDKSTDKETETDKPKASAKSKGDAKTSKASDKVRETAKDDKTKVEPTDDVAQPEVKE